MSNKNSLIFNNPAHELEKIYSNNGVHGLRYFESRLQYYNPDIDDWDNITTGSNNITTGSNGQQALLAISPNNNNALMKLNNGYYVPAFTVSSAANNALTSYSDGYYVPKIPVNMATKEELDDIFDIINEKIQAQVNRHNTEYNTLTVKIKEIASNTTKQNTHNFNGLSDTIQEIVDLSILYSDSNVILNLELVIKNTSTSNDLTLQIEENGIMTMETNLKETEIQKYKLSNIKNYKILIEGEYDLYLYVNYI